MKLIKECKEVSQKWGFWEAVGATGVCSLLGKYLAGFPGLSLVGHLVLALLLGMLFQIWRSRLEVVRVGTPYIANRFLRLGIILMGFKLNVLVLFSTGISSLLVALIVTPITIVMTYLFCRLLHVDHTTSLLTGCGCGICGAAAVMGVSAPAKAKTDQSVLAIAIVCILGTVFTLIEVFLQPFLGLTDVQFGVMAGASLHEIAHAVAAGSASGQIGLDYAIITKLSRVLLLAPVALVVGFIEAKRHQVGGKLEIPIPWFMGGFLLASVIGSVFSFSPSIIQGLVTAAYMILGMAMAALGMNVNFGVIIRHGAKPLAAAFFASCILLGLAYILASVFF